MTDLRRTKNRVKMLGLNSMTSLKLGSYIGFNYQKLLLRSSRVPFSSISNTLKFNSLSSLLQVCSSSKSLTQAKQLHSHIIITHQNHPFLLTKLIQLYADCEDIASAHILFYQLPNPNVFAFTSLIGFYSKHGLTSQCITAYIELRLTGISPDGYVFPKIFKVCSFRSGWWLKLGVAVHKDAIVFGFESNLLVCNSMLDMYAKCGDVWSAEKVFDEMLERDVFSWNSMISGYVSNGLFQKAVDLFGLMRVSGDCEPDVVTWNTVMDAYCRMGLYDKASIVFQQIKEPNIISWTTLIKGYSSVGRHDVALRIFRDLVKIDNGLVLPDVDSLSSILVSCRFLGALASGKEVHGYGIKLMNENAFYNSAGAALLTLYSGCRRINYAENVFHRMDQSDIVTWNAMIYSLVDMELGHLALECFREMQGKGVQIDHTTASTILPVCDLRIGKEIHAYVMKSSFNLVIPVYNALIHMYSICGCIAYAYSVFSTMDSRDLVSWNTMISGFGTHGQGITVLQLLRAMTDSGIRPDSVTFSATLSACSHSGLVTEGMEIFYRMTQDFSLIPVKEHFSCVVDMMARAGRLEDAFDFINKMPLKPDKHVWGALLAACQEHQNVGVGKLAAEKLIALEPQEAGNYVTLSNIYSKAGRWDEAARIRKMMECQGSMKPSGLSLVGAGG